MADSSGAEVSRRTLLSGTIGAGFTAAGICAGDVVSAAELEAGMVPEPPGGLGGPGGTGGGLVLPRPGLMPRIYTRAEWRAVPPRRKAKVLRRPPDHIVVHHTATPNTGDFSLRHALSLSRGIQRYHMQRNRWDDTGQQLTISRGGHVMEGRNKSLAAILSRRHVVGAQTLHHNEHTLGIESEGTYTTQNMPGPLWSSLVRVCAWLCTVYGLDPARALVGHRDYNRTECPGNALYARLPLLRAAVALAMRSR